MCRIVALKLIGDICSKLFGDITDICSKLIWVTFAVSFFVTLPLVQQQSKTMATESQDTPWYTPKVSIAWKYFTKVDAQLVKCKVCEKDLRCSGNTTNMLRHLHSRHPLVLSMAGDAGLVSPPEEEMQSSKRKTDAPSSSGESSRSLESAYENKPRDDEPIPSQSLDSDVSEDEDAIAETCGFLFESELSSKRQDGITAALMNFIISSMIPMSVIEGEGFRRLVECLEPRYKLPSTQYLEAKLQEHYDTGHEKLSEMIHGTEAMALSCYAFTLYDSRVYMTIMVHFVGDQHEVQSFVLDTCPLPEDPSERSPTNMLQIILDNIADYDLDERKITAIVHPTSPDLIQCMDLLSLEMHCETITCMGSRLKDCINIALSFPAIDEIVTATRTLASFFHPDSSAAEELQKQGQLDGDIHQYGTGHWTDVFEMCRSLAEQQLVVSSLIDQLKNDDESGKEVPVDLTDEQWETLHALVNVLMPIASAVKILSAEKFVSVSSLRAILHSMMKKIKVNNDEDPEAIRKFKETIRAEIQHRFQLEELLSSPPVATVATAFDPRHKTLKYHSAEQRKQMQGSMRDYVKDVSPKSENRQPKAKDSPPSKRSKSEMSDLLGSDSEDSDEELQDHETVVKAEIQAYSNDKVLSRESDPLEWWHHNETRYPVLSAAAKRYLCIPSTAALPRDAFTKDESTLMPEMAGRLTFEMMECLIFLKYNEKICGFTKSDISLTD